MLFLDGAPLTSNPATLTLLKDGRTHQLRAEARGHVSKQELVAFDRDEVDATLVLAKESRPSSTTPVTGKPKSPPNTLVTPDAPSASPAVRPPPPDEFDRSIRGRHRIDRPRILRLAAPGRRSPFLQSTIRRSCAVLLALSSLTASSVTWADSEDAAPTAPPPARPAGANALDEARAHYEVGVQLYSENDYEGALVELERAYTLAPSFRILYNLGRLHRKLNDYAAALRAFELYLATGTDIPNDRKSEVLSEIDTLKARVAIVEIKTNIANAALFLDDMSVNPPQGGTLAVNPGRHKVAATKAGYVPAMSYVTVVSGDALLVSLDLQPIDDGSSTKARTDPHTDTRPRNRAIVAWSVTGVLAIGAARIRRRRAQRRELAGQASRDPEHIERGAHVRRSPSDDVLHPR